MVEYALLLTAFAIPVIAGLTAGGVAMMKEYQEVRESLLRPFP